MAVKPASSSRELVSLAGFEMTILWDDLRTCALVRLDSLGSPDTPQGGVIYRAFRQNKETWHVMATDPGPAWSRWQDAAVAVVRIAINRNTRLGQLNRWFADQPGPPPKAQQSLDF